MAEIEKLIAGFRAFRAVYFEQRPELFESLNRGQNPKVLVVACSDSRVDPAILTNAAPGELFVIRNVANLVPPHQPDQNYHGTSAALEFAVRDLKVDHIIVLGHSRCGGIQALCSSESGNPMVDRDFINNWVSIAKGACCGGDGAPDNADTERRSILRSLDNLRSFPWIAEREKAGDLTLHGWWFHLEKGELWAHDAETDEYKVV